MRFDVERWAPPGYEWQQELKTFAGLAVAAGLWSLSVYAKLADEIGRLYRTRPDGIRILRDGAICEDFAEIAEGSFSLFPLMSLAMAACCALHMLYFFRGSRSIYTMRRLPDGKDLWRRTLPLPLCCAGLTLLLGGVLLAVAYGIYHWTVPAGRVAPGQGALLMDWLLGG